MRVLGLCVSTPDGPDIQDLDFRVRAGEAVALTSLGPCDLPTLVEVLSGLRWPDGGTVSRGDLRSAERFHSSQPRLRSYQSSRKLRITGSLVSPTVSLINNLSLFDNIALPLRYHFAPSEKVVDERTGRLLEALHLTSEARERPAGLARGIVRRTQLARALILEPTVIFLDSFISDIDQESARLIVAALREYLEKGILAVVAAGYDPLPLLPLVSRVLVLFDGRLAGSMEGEDLDEKNFLENMNRLGRRLQKGE
ncbi:MAG: ATP-binding cassette domain-containing protein [Planctomycetes bacterium]|nr:ATP-binding cassette domain-containing protein [Planctomycetota bacterium]